MERFFPDDGTTVYYTRQLEIALEDNFFHWITSKAANELAGRGIIASTQEDRGQYVARFFWPRRHRYPRRQIKAALDLVDQFSAPLFTRAVGTQGELLADSGFAGIGFRIVGRNIKSANGRIWTKTNHDLDRLVTRDGILYGVEIKNQLAYIDQTEFQVKLAMCEHMGIRPLFVARMMPRSYIEDVRKAPPDETVASRIVHGEIDGRKLTDDEIAGTVFFLWDGGMDTVAATSSLIFRRLALDPELQQLLRDNPERMANAVEEFLRMNPTVNTVRVAKVDHELEGQQIRAGDRLLCLVASGNFDPDKYENPREFRLDRSHNRHMTFVAGPHRCLGINLARFELRIALSEFLRRIPAFRMKPGAECVATPGLLGAPKVPIEWDLSA